MTTNYAAQYGMTSDASNAPAAASATQNNDQPNYAQAYGLTPDIQAAYNNQGEGTDLLSGLKNLAIGAATGAQNIHNAPYNIYKSDIQPALQYLNKNPTIAAALPGGIGYLLGSNTVANAANPMPAPININWGQEFGNTNPGALGRFTQNTVANLPGIVAGGASIPGQVIANTAYGLTQSTNPVTNALTNTLTSAAGGALGAGLSKGINAIRPSQIMLNMANNGQYTPAQAFERQQAYFTGPNGEQLPVDIGTLSGNSSLTNGYNSLGYVPFSGVAGQKNAVAAGAWQAQQAAKGAPDFATYNQNTAAINSAPQILQSMRGNENPTDFANNIGQNVYQNFAANKQYTGENYDAIRSIASDDYLNPSATNGDLQPYRNAVQKFVDQEQDLKNLYGNDEQTSGLLTQELGRAKALLGESDTPQNQVSSLVANMSPDVKALSQQSNPELFGATEQGVPLNMGFDRSKALGDFAAQQKLAGNRPLAAAFTQMQKGLDQSLDGYMTNNGLSDLANYKAATDANWRQTVLPYYENKEMNNVVTNPPINDPYSTKGPQPTYTPDVAALGAELHAPENAQVLAGIDQPTKDKLIAGMVTKEGGGNIDAAGNITMSPQDIANSYANLDGPVKTSIASHNPQANLFLQSLGDKITQNAAYSPPNFAKGISAAGASRALLPIAGAAGWHFLSGAVPAAGGALSLVGRALAKTATSPALRNAFLTGTNIAPSAAQNALPGLGANLANYYLNGNQTN